MDRFAIFATDYKVLAYFFAPLDAVDAFFACVCADRGIDTKTASYGYVGTQTADQKIAAVYRMAGTLD